MLLSLTDEVQKLRDEIEQAVVDSTLKKPRRYRKQPGDNDGTLCLFCCLDLIFL